MTSHVSRRMLLLLAVAACLAPLLAAAQKPEQMIELQGKVIPLAELVAKTGSKLDEDADPLSLVLVADDGKVYFLVKDSGGRMFFKDKTLLARPMILKGQLLPGTQIFLVGNVNSIVKGERREVFYWCDICAIKRNEMMICECCGAPMYLREEPIK